MHGKRFWLRPTSIVLALPVVGLLVWEILGGGLTTGTPGSVAPRDPTGAVPARVAASTIRLADSVRWCDEGLGCNDTQ